MRSSPPAIDHIFLAYASSTVAFLFFCLLAAASGFFLRAPLSTFHFFAAAGLTVLVAVYSCSLFPYRGKVLDSALVILLLAASFALFFGLAGSFFDLSYDGQAYHQEAITHLSRGWNPFLRPLEEWEVNRMGRWLQHYSKGPWIWQTIASQAMGSLEAAKGFHLWLMAAAFFMTLSFFLRFRILRPLPAFLVSLLAAFNPVAIYQSLSFYLDGQLMSLVLILFVTLAYLYREPRPYYYFLLFMVIAVLVNLKLTAPFYAVVFAAGYLLLLWIRRKRSLLVPACGTAAAALLVGMAVFGYSPYVTNTLQKGNPFYPALGTDRADYTFPQFPANYENRDPVTLLFFSIFSKSDNVRGKNKTAYLKVPFTVSPEELNAFTDTNAKQGGFGPLFSGAVLIALLILAVAAGHLYSFFRGLGRGRSPGAPAFLEAAERSPVFPGLFSCGVIFASCVINPASSLARFIPQFWLLPLIAVLLAYSLPGRFLRLAGHALLLTLLLNNALIAGAYFHYNYRITNIYEERLGDFARKGEEAPLRFYFGHFLSSGMRRFGEVGIRYQRVEKLDGCKEGRRILPNSIILICSD